MSGPFVPFSVKESPVQQLVLHPVNPGDTTCAHVDVLVVTNHHSRSTHLDSIFHISNNGMVYPGRSAAEAITPAGNASPLATPTASAIRQGSALRIMLGLRGNRTRADRRRHGASVEVVVAQVHGVV